MGIWQPQKPLGFSTFLMQVGMSWVKRTVWLWALLLVIFFPIHLDVLPNLYLAESVFGWLVRLLLQALELPHGSPLFYSDSAGLFVLVAFFLVISVIMSWVLRFWNERWKALFLLIATTSVRYLLSLELLKYGLAKVFHDQFYAPEPNTLFTSFGFMDRDILFWSVMGLAPGLQTFLGLVEVVAGLLLLHRRTMHFGALVSVGILFPVLLINLGFDISVKLLSSLLLLAAVSLAWPLVARIVYAVRSADTRPSGFQPPPRLHVGLAASLALLVLAESSVPYARRGFATDEQVPAPALHGAYQFIPAVSGAFLGEPNRTFERMFVHRAGYMIFQDQQQPDFMPRMRLEVYPDQRWTIQNADTSLSGKYEWHFAISENERDSTLVFWWTGEHFTFRWSAVPLDWKTMPALTPDRHFFANPDVGRAEH